MEKLDILVCSALPYANGIIHLGHIYSTFLPADIFCRLHKMLSHKVRYISGSDAYGSSVLASSIKSCLDTSKDKVSPYDIYKTHHIKNKILLNNMLIDIDTFGTTCCKKHSAKVLKVYKELLNQEKLLWKDDLHCFCAKDGFIPDQLSNCSLCNSSQCEHESPKICCICGNNVSSVLSNTLFLKLNAQKSQSFFDSLNKNITTETIGNNIFCNSTLEAEKAISRNISWGISIPNTSSVFYVWFDALIGYMSIGEQDWQTAKQRVMFMGKDNLYFHLHMMPNIYEVNADVILSGHFLCLDGKKFSKSEHHGISVDCILKPHVEYIRFYLSYISNYLNDGNFSWKQFIAVTNDILIDKIYNSIYRVLSLYKSQKLNISIESDIPSEISEYITSFENSINKGYLGEATKSTEQLAGKFNTWIQNNEIWKNMDNIKIEQSLWYCGAIISMLYLILPVRMKDLFNFFFYVSELESDMIGFVNKMNRNINFEDINLEKMIRINIEEVDKDSF